MQQTRFTWWGFLTAGLVLLLGVASCGGGHTAPTKMARVQARVVWEQPGGGFGSELPEGIRTVEMRIETAKQTFRAGTDAAVTRDLAMDGLPPGNAMIRIFAYNVPAPLDELGAVDFSRLTADPTFSSDGMMILIRVGQDTDAGEIKVFARQPLASPSPTPTSTPLATETDTPA